MKVERMHDEFSPIVITLETHEEALAALDAFSHAPHNLPPYTCLKLADLLRSELRGN